MEGGPEALGQERCGRGLLSAGRKGSPRHLLSPRSHEVLLRLPRSLANSGDGLCGLLRQLGRVGQDGCGGAQVPEGVQHSRPEDGQGAVLVQPGQCRPVQLLQAAGGHHTLEGLKEWLDDDAELHSRRVKEKVREHGEKEAQSQACL